MNEGRFAISISQNSSGFRDVEQSIDKPPGARRVLCCGDSFTWGWGVEQDQIYTTILQRRYADARVDIRFVDSYLRARATPDASAYIPIDGRWTADGHRWIADLLYDDVLADWRPEQ